MCISACFLLYLVFFSHLSCTGLSFLGLCTLWLWRRGHDTGTSDSQYSEKSFESMEY